MKTVQERLQEITDKAELFKQMSEAPDADAAIAMAHAAGIVITVEEIEQFLESQDIELSNEQLTAAAGGFWGGIWQAIKFAADPVAVYNSASENLKKI